MADLLHSALRGVAALPVLLSLAGPALATDVISGDLRITAELFRGELNEWKLSLSFFAADVTDMTLTPPGGTPFFLDADASAPSPTGASFRYDASYPTREAFLEDFPEGSYVVTVVDSGATVALFLETAAVDGLIFITTPPDGAEGVSSTPIFDRDNQCQNCEEELITLYGVDFDNWDILLQELREDVFPDYYTLADLDWIGQPPAELPDGRYQLSFEALIEEVREPRFSDKDDFWLYLRGAAHDVSFFEVPEPSLQLGGAFALLSLLLVRRRAMARPGAARSGAPGRGRSIAPRASPP